MFLGFIFVYGHIYSRYLGGYIRSGDPRNPMGGPSFHIKHVIFLALDMFISTLCNCLVTLSMFTLLK